MGRIRPIILAYFWRTVFDYVLCGEAEETLRQLCAALLAGEATPISVLDGLVRSDENGQPVHSGKSLWRRILSGRSSHCPRAISSTLRPLSQSVDGCAWILLHEHGVEPGMSLSL